MNQISHLSQFDLPWCLGVYVYIKIILFLIVQLFLAKIWEGYLNFGYITSPVKENKSVNHGKNGFSAPGGDGNGVFECTRFSRYVPVNHGIDFLIAFSDPYNAT